MLVSRISPAPCRTHSRAHATASRPTGFRPPRLTTSQRETPGVHPPRRPTPPGGALLLVAQRQLARVADVAQVHEAMALDHAIAAHVEARDDAMREHQPALPPAPGARSRVARSTAPLVLNTSPAGASAWRSAKP